jgi:hypothetical protein
VPSFNLNHLAFISVLTAGSRQHFYLSSHHATLSNSFFRNSRYTINATLHFWRNISFILLNGEHFGTCCHEFLFSIPSRVQHSFRFELISRNCKTYSSCYFSLNFAFLFEFSFKFWKFPAQLSNFRFQFLRNTSSRYRISFSYRFYKFSLGVKLKL